MAQFNFDNNVPPTVQAAISEVPKKLGDTLKNQVPHPPKMRSYVWALSGDFSAKLELFGEAQTADDLDALADYVEITVKALKRSLKSAQTVTQ